MTQSGNKGKPEPTNDEEFMTLLNQIIQKQDWSLTMAMIRAQDSRYSPSSDLKESYSRTDEGT